MSGKPFDAALKDVVERHAADWVRLLGPWPVREVRVLDAETSTVTSAADKALRVDSGAGIEWILHPEFVSGYKAEFPRQLWWYNSVFHQRHGLAVVSVALLLRRQADGPEMVGHYSVRAPHDDQPYQVLRYRIERLWQWPAERLLNGGIGALPLAPLTDDAAESLPRVIARIDSRLQDEAAEREREHLMTATTLLMGLRHTKDAIRQAMKGASTMWNSVIEDSSIVQDWLERAKEEGKRQGKAEGKAEGIAEGKEEGKEEGMLLQARQQLFRLGQAKFGSPDCESTSAIEAIADIGRLDDLSLRLLKAMSWRELLSP